MTADQHQLYFGAVSHTRHAPMVHKLKYKIAYVCLDLDHMDTAGHSSWMFNPEKPGLFSFRAKDHGSGETTDLAKWVRQTLKDKSVEAPAHRITFLTLPRMLGYAFNPISVYFIYDASDHLHHILYQVNNTFGERHCYLFPVSGDGPAYEHSCQKRFHVSPFFPVSGNYTFRICPPNGETFSLFIKYDDAECGKAMTATLELNAKPFSSGSFAKLLFGLPFMTLGVTAAIHWEACKLWLKKARYHSRPRKPDDLVEHIPSE